MTNDSDEGRTVDIGVPKWAFAAMAGPVGIILGGLLWRGDIPWWPPVVGALWSILVVLAILGMLEPASRGFIAGTLKRTNFTQIYIAATRRRLDWVWTRLCDPVGDQAGVGATFRAALTWRLYDRALLIAVVYPILLLIGAWIYGGGTWEGVDATLGPAVVIPAAPFWPDRAVPFGAVLAFIAAKSLESVGSSAGSSRLETLTVVLTILAIVSATATANLASGPLIGMGFMFTAIVVMGAYDIAGGLSVALMVVFAVIGVGISAGTPSGIVPLVAAGAIAFASSTAEIISTSKGRPATARLWVTAGLPLSWLILAGFYPWEEASGDARGFFLFLGVLPLLNALFDVVSYAVTLTLMRLGLRAGQPWLFGLLDFAVALVLFLGLGATLTVVVAVLNRVAGVAIFDLGGLFGGIHVDPGAYWWLYAMVFSTILPTAVHGGVSLLGFQGLVPLGARRRVADLFAGAPGAQWKAAVAPILVGTVWLVPFLAVGLVLWGLWLVSGDALSAVGGFYLDALLQLSVWIGAV